MYGLGGAFETFDVIVPPGTKPGRWIAAEYRSQGWSWRIRCKRMNP